MSTSSEIDSRAQTGFAKSAAYDQHRPAYSASIVQFLLEKLNIAAQNGAKILDLAAGTGKLTEAVAAREEQYQIIAVEPHDGMRQVLADKKMPGVKVLGGKADCIPLEDTSVDAVICAQSFHWFANMESLREIHRVLHPHGGLGMVWNIEDYNNTRQFKPATDWEAKAHELIWTFKDDAPRYRHEEWKKVFDEQVKSTPLSLLTASDQLFSLPLAEDEERFEVWLPKDKVWERYNTLSHIAVLEGEDRERTYNTFMDAINSAEVETDENGNIPVHGTTYVRWTMKIPVEGQSGFIDDVKEALRG